MEIVIYVNDPHFDDAPIAVPRGDFELAWLERDYYYALITLKVSVQGATETLRVLLLRIPSYWT